MPLYYDTGDDGVPHGWIERIKNNWATLGWNVIAGRMVRDYTTQLYEPAAAAADMAVADDAATARELAAWRTGVTSVWESVTVTVDPSSAIGDGVAGARRRTARNGRPRRAAAGRAPRRDRPRSTRLFGCARRRTG